MECTGSGRMNIAIFPSLSTGLDLAVQIVGEAIQIPGAWTSINARPLSTLTKLWQRLNCYRDSTRFDHALIVWSPWVARLSLLLSET